MNPGFAYLIGLVSAGLCDRVDKITVLESVDSTGYDSPATEIAVGYDRRLSDPKAICDAAPGIRTYADLPLITARGLTR